YARLRAHWDREARAVLAEGRHPLDFEQLLTVDDHAAHKRLVEHLSASHRPAIVIAASGMCAGGRILDYLKAMLGDPRHDVLFVGYQARGTPGWAIQHYGPRGGYVELEGERIDIRARIHRLGGYSAHADQGDLLDFVAAMQPPPREVVLVHGEDEARAALARALSERFAGVVVRQ
ncbi:MAG: MBL fold metallo-hydrolase, partial [Chromatiaceae bacterium]|nr:MBL fold metallo-hydrolase [Chromatiaceae bacterium]